MKIILLTAKGKDEAKKGYDAGANEYLVKPIDRDELCSRIAAQIQSRWFMRQEHGREFTERQIDF